MDLNANLPGLAAQFGVTLVAAIAAAYAAFRWLGQKWLEGKFAERLEAFKHAQNREIEELRFRISALLDRTTKLHQHEFEALPELWDKLTIDLSRALAITSRNRPVPMLERMNSGELNDFLAKSPIVDWERGKILEVSREERTDAYAEMIWWHDLRDAFYRHGQFHNYFISKGIFIQPEMKAKIGAISDLILDALNEQQQEKQHPNLRQGRFAKSDQLQAEGEALLRDIERDLQSRLWNAGKLS